MTSLSLDEGFKSAFVNFEEGDYDSAEKKLLSLYNENPLNQKILNLLSVNYKKMKLYDKALFYCEEMININPSIYEAWVNKGDLLNDLQRFEESKNALEKALEIDSNRIESRVALMDTLISVSLTESQKIDNSLEVEKLQSHQDVLKYVSSLIKDYPQNVFIRQKIGLYFKKLKLWDKAIAVLERLVDDKISIHLLECLYERDDKTEELIKYLNFCNKVHPNLVGLAEISDFICSQYEIINPYKFVPQGLKFIKKQSVKSFLNNESFHGYNDTKINQVILKKKDNKSTFFKFENINNSLILSNDLSQMIEKSLENFFTKEDDELRIFNEWPEKTNLNISLCNTGKPFKRLEGSWISAILFSNKNNEYYKKDLKISFDYIQPSMTLKSKKNRGQSISAKNNDLIIFPSSIIPKVSSSKDLNYFIINFIPLIKK